MTIRTESYPYEPTPNDIANFEAVWLALWHPRFSDLEMQEYMQFKNLVFEAVLVGINQHKHDLRLSLEKSLGGNNDS